MQLHIHLKRVSHKRWSTVGFAPSEQRRSPCRPSSTIAMLQREEPAHNSRISPTQRQASSASCSRWTAVAIQAAARWEANLLFEDVVDLRLTPAGLRLVIFRRSIRAIRETPRSSCTHLQSSTSFILLSGTSAITSADKLSGRTCREAAMFCWLACRARERLRAHCRSAIVSRYEFQFGFQAGSAGGYEPPCRS